MVLLRLYAAERFLAIDDHISELTRDGGTRGWIVAYDLPDEPPRSRNLPLPPATRAQPCGLVSVGRGGVRQGPGGGQAGLSLDRLFGMPLVPRDGAGVVRGRGGRGDSQRELRRHQSRSRGAAGRRFDLHAGRADDDRARRLADVDVPHAGRAAVLRRHLLPTRGSSRHARASGACSITSPTPIGPGARRSRKRRSSVQQALSGHLHVDRDRGGRSIIVLSTPRQRASRRATTRCTAGFGGAPKFPPSMALDFLMQAGASRPATRHLREIVSHDADEDGPRRDVRPGRRRLSPLLRRCPMARPALREDALRQRSPGAPLHAGLAMDQGAALRTDRQRDPRLRPTGDDLPGRRVLRDARRRLRRRGGKVLRLVSCRGHGGARPRRKGGSSARSTT